MLWCWHVLKDFWMVYKFFEKNSFLYVKYGYCIMLICGIDEAGRGPLISSLVVCGVIIEEEDRKNLQKIGVKDSKLIAPLKRERIEVELKKIVKAYHVIEVEPLEIDKALNSTDLNLNWLEAIKAAEIIKKLKPDKVILDCPSTNIPAFTEYVKNTLKNMGYSKKTEIISEHKADEKYVEVGAASIIAKVRRENIIKELKKKYGDFGSGYPSDPKTQKFLKENWKKHPEIFRRTWQSYTRMEQNSKQSKLGQY